MGDCGRTILTVGAPSEKIFTSEIPEVASLMPAPPDRVSGSLRGKIAQNRKY